MVEKIFLVGLNVEKKKKVVDSRWYHSYPYLYMLVGRVIYPLLKSVKKYSFIARYILNLTCIVLPMEFQVKYEFGMSWEKPSLRWKLGSNTFVTE